MQRQWITIDVSEDLQPQHNSPDQNPSIYRVPKILTDINPQAYRPMLVSLGPYHRRSRHLPYMEKHKLLARSHYLRRIARDFKDENDVVNIMREVEPQLQAFYDNLHIVGGDSSEQVQHQEVHDSLNKDEDDFLQLMITDGCFILEFMRAMVRFAGSSDTEYDDSDSHIANSENGSENHSHVGESHIANSENDAAIANNENDVDANSEYHSYVSNSEHHSDANDITVNSEYSAYRSEYNSFVSDSNSEYTFNDSVFRTNKNNFFVPYLVNDMLLLENQLPLLALTTLAAIEGSGVEDVCTLIKNFCKLFWDSVDDEKIDEGQKAKQTCKLWWWLQWFCHLCHSFRHSSFFQREKKRLGGANQIEQSLEASIKQSKHILDLYRKMRIAEGKYRLTNEEKLSATKLRNAGVSFCKSKSKSFRDISFIGSLLSLPLLEINDTTESLLLNLIAFERLHLTGGNEVTAYVIFMNNLIDTVNDVALLKTKNIIEGIGVSDKEIAEMFDRITKGVTHVYRRVGKNDANVNRDLNNYCKKRLQRWRASFVETYLRNPWVFISLLGGLFLLALTVIQTVFSTLQYYHT